MTSIGGYFEWEFPTKSDNVLHRDAVRLNSGRYALEYILRGFENIKVLWIPYFTCEVVLEPLERLGIQWNFYHINELLELAEPINLHDSNYLLYTNYYGIKDLYIKQLLQNYGNKLIVDNAQALYCEPIAAHQFYSPRKYVGMPDGGLAITSNTDKFENLPRCVSYNRCSHLLKRIDLGASDGYEDFRKNDSSLSKEVLSQMSALSSKIYDTVDFEHVKRKRCDNFKLVHNELCESNRLQIPPMDSFACPLVYPYWSDKTDLKQKLIERGIFVATYWPNVFDWCKPNELEYELANQVVCIPIDQRYGKEEMKFIVQQIREL